MSKDNLFFELIRVSIGQQICLSHSPSADEWEELYAIAKKQSLVGVCFAGVQRLQSQIQVPPEMLYLKWMGMAAKIQQRNEVLNQQCVDLQKRLSADGMQSTILKGQGVAQLYPKNLSVLRQSGDIDVWIAGGRKKVIDYVQQIAPTNDIRDNHAALNIFANTEVEAHFRPAILRNPIRNKKLQKFFEKVSNSCFDNKLNLESGKISVPTVEFNLVYQIVHIYEHFFTEGVGLRQVMDYFFVLRDARTNGFIGDKKLQEVLKIIHSLGIDRFTSALMWVIKTVFVGHENVDDNLYLWKPNEADGKLLLTEILHSGNFGKHDERQKGMYNSKWNSFWIVHFKTLRFLRFDHWAWFWSPLWRVFGFVVRKINSYN